MTLGETLKKLIVEKNESFDKFYNALDDNHFIKMPFSLFSPMGYSQWELAYTKVLAFFFDPKASHGLGSAFLEKFLKYLGFRIVIKKVTVESEKMLSESDRIDIWIEILTEDEKGIILAIEAKVNALEGENQLERYRKEIRRRWENHHRSLVFMTPEGREGDSLWISFSYKKLIPIIDELVRESDETHGRIYLSWFAASILRDIMGIKLIDGEFDSVASYKLFSLMKEMGK